MLFRSITTLLGLVLACRAVLFAAANLAVAPVQRSYEQAIRGDDYSFTVEVKGQTPPVNRSVTLTGPARDVHLLVEGGYDFSSIGALAASIVRPGMTDEEKVRAIFYWVIERLYDRGGSGCEDPLEYISLWGFSWCGNYGLLLNALWKAAGFPTVFLNPVIGMPSGHTITAVYYDNQWHLYDSRLRGYFLNRDNRTVASLVELDRDDGLIRRGMDYEGHFMGHWGLPLITLNYANAESDWYDGFNSHFDNQKLFNAQCPVWDPRLDLREGETLRLDWKNSGKWWNRKDLSPTWQKLHRGAGREATEIEPLVFANGTLTFTPDPAKIGGQAHSRENIRISREGFQPEKAGVPARLVYRVRVPYFIPSMSVEADLFRKTDRDRFSVEISTDEGQSWLPVWAAESTGEIKVRCSSDQTQRVTWYSENKYSYLLRFNLEAAQSAADLRLTQLRIVTDLFYRPHILPELKNGINRVLWKSAGTAGRPSVRFDWLEDTNILFSDDRPADGDKIKISALVANHGDTPAENVQVRFYDGDPARGGVPIGQEAVIERIEPGRAATAEVEWVAVQRHLGSAGGFSISRNERLTGYVFNTIYAVVDPDGRVAETDESDNATTREVVVYNKANLILGDPSFVDIDGEGEILTLTAHVRNQNLYGLLPRAREARSVRVRFYDGQPQVNDLSARLIGEAVIPEIPAGEFGVARVKWNVGGLSGRHLVYVVSDPLDEIQEKWQQHKGDYMFVKKEINLPTGEQAAK
ncbi:MAG: CARDB domain-containing protein [Candidatus Glassbacteria bacterium]